MSRTRCCENFLYGFKAARRAARAANAASLSRGAWRSITSWQFLGYGPALSVAAPAGPLGELGEQVRGFYAEPAREFPAGPVLAGLAGHDAGDLVSSAARAGRAG